MPSNKLVKPKDRNNLAIYKVSILGLINNDLGRLQSLQEF